MQSQSPSPSPAPSPDFQPILALLSLDSTPLVKDMTDDQLREHIARIRSLATNTMELKSQLTSEATIAGKPTAKSAKKQSILDSI